MSYSHPLSSSIPDEEQAHLLATEPTRAVSAATTSYLGQLDPMRGVAILMVIVFHGTIFTLDESLGRAQNVDGVFYRTARFGWIGVDLFFVLSGFLITRLLIRSKGRHRFLTNFYARRALRIFPLYFGVMALWTLVTQLHLSNSFGATPWLWTYTSNLLIGWRGWSAVPVSVGHFWSLALEEQFYLVWPFVVLWCTSRALLRIAAAMLVTSIAARAACVVLGYPDAPHVLPLCRADSLLAGAALALLLGNADAPGPGLQKIARRLAWLSAGAVTVIAMLHGGRLDAKDPWVATLGLTALSLLMVSVLSLVLASKTPEIASPVRRVLTRVGKYSYAMYVFQQPVLLALSRSLGGVHQNLLRQALVVVLGAGISFLLALVSWHALEKHTLALKRHFA